MLPQTPSQSPEPSTPKPVRVKITRKSNATHGFSIDTSHRELVPGTIEPILPFFSREHQKLLRGWTSFDIPYVLKYAHTSGSGYPTLVEWQDALAHYLVNEMAAQVETEPTVLISPFQTDAYVALGDGIYKLQPVAIAKTTKALTIIRKRASGLARADANRIMADAQRSVLKLHGEAQKRLDEVNAQKEALRLAHPSTVPPSWALNRYELFFNPTLGPDGRGAWLVGGRAKIHLKKFECTKTNHAGDRITKEWDALPHEPFFIRYWVEPTEHLACSSIRLGKAEARLPHMNYDSSCMSPSMAPPKITSYAEFEQLRSAIESAMSGVDLGSVLNPFDYWDARLQGATPEVLRNAMRGQGRESTAASVRTLTAQRETTLRANTTDTFNLDHAVSIDESDSPIDAEDEEEDI